MAGGEGKVAHEEAKELGAAPREARRLDVIVWGATGFTGKLVVEYLSEHYGWGKKVKWGIGGRSRERLEAVKATAVKLDPACAAVEIFVGDVTVQRTVDAVVRQARAIVATAGPFDKYGEAVVSACARLGTDYVDITGEVGWVSKMQNRYAHMAVESGACLVSMCGFDSVPAELSTLLVVEDLKRRAKQPCRRAISYVSMNGAAGPSGGTLATIFNAIEKGDAGTGRWALNPTGTSPNADDKALAKEESEYLLPGRDREVGLYTAPFIMAACNTRVVRKSAALNQYGGEDGGPFTYNECVGSRSFLAALVTWLTIVVFGILAIMPCTRALLKRLLPGPGQGPTPEQQKKDKFTYRCVGFSPDGQHRSEATVRGGNGGYYDTARMITESALCMALQRKDIPLASRFEGKGGFYTPASALGLVLVDRLNEHSGTMRLEVTQLEGANNKKEK